MKSSKSPSRRDVAIGLAALSGVPARAAEPISQHLNPAGLSTPRGYTHVVVASGGRTVYVSGQVSANPKGEIVGKGDLKTQTTTVFENLRIALAAAGATPRDVVKKNIYVVNLKPDDVQVVREVRNAFFGAIKPPASTLVGITALAHPDYLIEIEAVAVVA
jgi:enamine deaminase RidA (YjgF/YER057c/UK114 family)